LEKNKLIFQITSNLENFQCHFKNVTHVKLIGKIKNYKNHLALLFWPAKQNKKTNCLSSMAE
jgi:hypothetical protein